MKVPRSLRGRRQNQAPEGGTVVNRLCNSVKPKAVGFASGNSDQNPRWLISFGGGGVLYSSIYGISILEEYVRTVNGSV